MTTPELFTRDGAAFTGRATTNERDQLGYWERERTCHRCGGAGGSDKWKFTGWTCFECGGARKVPSERFIRLYDAARLADLNARAAKAEATRERKRLEREAAEAARVLAEREAIVAAHADILARMRPLAERSDFLADMIAQIEERARALSERQLEAATNACAKMEAEDARRKAATHVGEVGERLTLNLTYLRALDLSRDYEPPFVIWTFRTDDGNTVIFKGGFPKAFDAIPTEVVGEGRDSYRRRVKGSRIAIKATIKAHEHHRTTGEPETIIMRPAAG